MYSLKSFLPILIVLIDYGVSSLEIGGRQNGEGTNRRLTASYRFNHPPDIENFQAIPVAVIYKDDTSRKQKSLEVKDKQEVELPNENLQPTNDHLKEEHSSKKTPISGVVTDSNAHATKVSRNGGRNEQHKSQLRKLSAIETHIPVAVVYDPQPEIMENERKNVPSNTGDRVKRRKIRKRPQNTTEKPIPEIHTEKTMDLISNEHISTKIAVTIEKQETSTSEIPIKQRKIITSEARVENYSSIKKRTRQKDPVVPIINSENQVYSQSGSFKYSYEGGDGTKALQTGELKSFDEDKTGEAVVGSFSYKDKEGNDFSLSYTADENGYRPVGAHLPTPPPIPPAIARALLYLATKPTEEPVTEPISED